MRPFRLALAVALALGLSVQAGENKYLGAIVVSGASLTNLTTAAPFAIPPGSAFTVNCTAAVNMLVDNLSTAASGANFGLPIPANTNFPSSCGRALGNVSGNPSCVVAVFGTASCSYWLRDRTE